VVDGEGLSDQEMQAFAAWTNLAETTFLMPPTTEGADYKLRNLHTQPRVAVRRTPTLGSCASWRHLGGKSRTAAWSTGMQHRHRRYRCERRRAGVRRAENHHRALPPENLEAIISALGLSRDRIVRTAQLANGPVWQVLELASAADVLAADSARIRYPEFLGVGLIGSHSPGSECQFEVRTLATSSGMSEDPITGSLNAAIAQWMYGAGHWRTPVTVAQGTCIGREGRLFIRRDDRLWVVWVGGETRILIEGTLTL